MENLTSTLKDIMKNKTVSGLLVLCLLLSFFVMPGVFGADPSDTQGHFSQHLETQQLRALGAFAIAKGINAVISFLQSFDVSISPMGLGVQFSPLEFLDPVIDLIESVSNGLLMALGAITLQHIILSINTFLVFKVLLPLSLICFGVSLWISSSFRPKLLEISIKAAAICLVFGLFIPASVQLSIFLEDSVLEETIDSSMAQLEQSRNTIDVIGGEIAQLQEMSKDLEEKKEPVENEDKPSAPEIAREQTEPALENDAEAVPTDTEDGYLSNLFSSSDEGQVKEESTVEDDNEEGWWSRTKRGFSSAVDSVGIINMKETVGKLAQEMKAQAEKMANNFITLLAIFAINTVLLPLINLWVLRQLVRWILNKPFDPSLPSIPKRQQHATASASE